MLIQPRLSAPTTPSSGCIIADRKTAVKRSTYSSLKLNISLGFIYFLHLFTKYPPFGKFRRGEGELSVVQHDLQDGAVGLAHTLTGQDAHIAHRVVHALGDDAVAAIELLALQIHVVA